MTPEALGQIIAMIIGLAIAVGSGLGAFIKVSRATGISAKNTEEIEKTSKDITDLRGTVNALGDANEKLRIENAASNVQIEALKEDLKQKTAVIEQMRNQLDKSDDRQRENEKVVAELKGRLAEQRESADRQQKRLEQLIQTNAEERLRSSNLEAELKTEQTKNAALMLRTDGIQRELDQAKRDLSEETARRTSLEAQVNALQSEVKHLKDIPAPISVVVESKPNEAVTPPKVEVKHTSEEKKPNEPTNQSG